MISPFVSQGVRITCLSILLSVPGWTHPFLGEGIKGDMKAQCQRKHGRHLDFEHSLVGTPVRDRDATAAPIRFLTIQSPSGERLSRPAPVVATTEHNYSEGQSKIVGTAGSPPKSEPRATYEIRFPKPQRWAGVHRYGGDHVVTRFWSPHHELLHEFEGEGFVAWVNDTTITNQWVSRIEMTGTDPSHPFAGFTDDLMLGVSDLKPSWAAKRAAKGIATTRHRMGLDSSRSTPGGTNAIANATSGPETGADAPDLDEALKNPAPP